MGSNLLFVRSKYSVSYFHTSSVFSHLKVKDKVSHLHKSMGTIKCILYFWLLARGQTDNRFLIKRYNALLEFNLLLIFSFYFVTVIHKYLK